MEQIIVDKQNIKVTNGKKNLQSVIMGSAFESFLDSHRQNERNPKGLSEDACVRFRDETCDILSHSNPHDAVNAQETTHLVVGYVQSGKTMSFTGLTALARDNGYRVIIYLAGTKNNLLEQTTKRLRKDLIMNGGHNKNYKIHPNPTKSDTEDIIGDLESHFKPIVLLPILKHHKHILNVRDVFMDSELSDLMKNETVIIIDDEADQASLNSFGRKNSQSDEEDLSRTYDSILKLRANLPGNTYIQYTATPQANVLISIQDLLSPKSHTLLTPGEGYIGGKLFFGRGKGNELYNGGLIMEIPSDQVFHKIDNPLRQMPQSLKDALMLHILAVAIVVYWKKVPGINYLSMMVHPDNKREWNKKFKDWIENELKWYRKLLLKPDDYEEKVNLLNRFKQLFDEAVLYYDEEERPTFEDIEIFIPEILGSKKVYLVTSDVEAQTNIYWEDYSMHILVGGEMLNRGFTVEKLATTYMPRYTKGTANADTIQQRCRFFGYKRDYIKSCRVFLPNISITNYYAYIDHEEELRTTLASCDTLAIAERKLLLSPTLRPTRSNILPISVVNRSLKGMHPLQAFASKVTIEHNDEIVNEFLQKHKEDWTVIDKYNTPDRTHRWMKLEVDEAIQFLGDFNFKNLTDALQKSATIRYLRYLSAEDIENPIRYVYFYQMAYASEPRVRSFDPENNRLAANTRLFAGPSSAHDSTNYPGDVKIVGESDSITIQLHHIQFSKAPLSFPRQAYTLAIYYPDELAVNYCANVGDTYDDEDN